MVGGVRRHRMMGRLRRAMLAVDAWLDTSLFQGGRSLRDTYDDYSAFMDRFSLVGWRRGLTELASETLSLGLGGAIVALALAIPAFQDTSEDWLKKQDLAVTFLDRSGAEVGRRGILHDDSVPIEQMPPYLIQAILATEDRRFYEHFGIDLIGTLRAVTVNAKSSGVVQGGSSITQQLAKKSFPLERADLRAQDQGGLPGAVARTPPHQARDPADLSSTASTWAAARSGSRRRRNSTSARRSGTSRYRKPRCWPGFSRRPPNTPRTSTFRLPVPAPAMSCRTSSMQAT